MPADAPTIIATSGGRIPCRTPWEVGPLTEHAVELSRVSGRRPRVCFLATAMGDSAAVLQSFYDAARFAGLEASHLALFPMPNVDDHRAHLLAQDVVWVWGGSVAGLLAMWRLHGLDVMREAWQAGVVLTGVSGVDLLARGRADRLVRSRPAGRDQRARAHPVCQRRPLRLRGARRPLLHRLVADGTLPTAYATDDGVGLHYRGTELVEALTEIRPGRIPGRAATGRLDGRDPHRAAPSAQEPLTEPGGTLGRMAMQPDDAVDPRRPATPAGSGRAGRRAGPRGGQAAPASGCSCSPDGARQRWRSTSRSLRMAQWAIWPDYTDVGPMVLVPAAALLWFTVSRAAWTPTPPPDADHGGRAARLLRGARRGPRRRGTPLVGRHR